MQAAGWVQTTAAKVFRFCSKWKDADGFELHVAAAGTCSDKPEKARQATPERIVAQPSAEQRHHVLKWCGALVSNNVKLTPANLAVELGRSKNVAFRTFKALLRNMRGTLSASTQLWADSMASLEEFAASRQDDEHVLKIKHLTCSEQKFQWVAAVVQFLSAVEGAFKTNYAEYLMVTADWTHSLCHMGKRPLSLGIRFLGDSGLEALRNWMPASLPVPRRGPSRAEAWESAFSAAQAWKRSTTGFLPAFLFPLRSPS